MLRLALAVAMLVTSIPACAQSIDAARLITPTPLGVVLQMGRWLVSGREAVYEIQVQGTGDTLELAREQAFRTAVQQAVGSLIFTQTQVAQSEVRRNDIMVYSSGFVDRSEILRQSQDARGRTVLDMRVWIRRSTIADGLFGESTQTNLLDAGRTSASLNSLRNERRDGDRVIEAVLREFPARAFVIGIAKTAWSMDTGRQANLVLDIEIEWHDAWIQSLGQVLRTTNSITEDHVCNTNLSQCQRQGLNYAVINMRAGTWGLRQVAAWPDQQRLALMNRYLVDRGLSLRVTLETLNGAVLHRACVRPQQVQSRQPWNEWFNLMEPHQTGVELWAYVRNSGRITLQGIPDSVINESHRIQVAVVRSQQCS